MSPHYLCRYIQFAGYSTLSFIVCVSPSELVTDTIYMPELSDARLMVVCALVNRIVALACTRPVVVYIVTLAHALSVP